MQGGPADDAGECLPGLVNGTQGRLRGNPDFGPGLLLRLRGGSLDLRRMLARVHGYSNVVESRPVARCGFLAHSPLLAGPTRSVSTNPLRLFSCTVSQSLLS